MSALNTKTTFKVCHVGQSEQCLKSRWGNFSNSSSDTQADKHTNTQSTKFTSKQEHKSTSPQKYIHTQIHTDTYKYIFSSNTKRTLGTKNFQLYVFGSHNCVEQVSHNSIVLFFRTLL